MYRMRFSLTITPDGLYHVQNFVAGMQGQHHVHSAESFKRWRKDGDQINQAEDECYCGLAVGDVREFTGRLWHNESFE